MYKDENEVEKRIHDSVFIESIDRKARLAKDIANKLYISEDYLKDDEVLAEVILQLQRENSPIVTEQDEEIWRFLSDQSKKSEEPDVRSEGKNSFYNRKKAKEYIDTYWKNYNPSYPAFHDGGGDCANFISQVLYAGGMPWVDDGKANQYTWYTNWFCKPGATNKDGDKRISLSWKVAASFGRQWEKRCAKLIKISYKEAIESMDELSRMVYIGDPVQFCYASGVPYHTLVITGYAWDEAAEINDIVLASHSIDSNRRSLYNTLLKYPRDYQLRVYVIKEGE